MIILMEINSLQLLYVRKMNKFQLLLLFYFLSVCFGLKCWTGQKEKEVGGSWSTYIIQMSCDVAYCSNLTVVQSSTNITIVDFRCGSDILEDCTVGILILFLLIQFFSPKT